MRKKVEVTTHEVRVGGRLVRYQAVGAGEPVVLVHGLSGSSRWWARNIPALAERHRVYLVDLPGSGAMRSFPSRFVLAEAASWLLAWMDALDLRQPHLVGHSMGGYICIRVAASRPEAARRLVLVDPAGVPTARSIITHLVPLLRESQHLSLGFLPVLVRDAVWTGPFTLWRAARDLLGEDVREHLRCIAAPTLLVWGELDALVPATLGRYMREQIPDARLLILRRAGHVPMFDRPERFNAALLAFLAGEAVGS